MRSESDRGRTAALVFVLGALSLGTHAGFRPEATDAATIPGVLVGVLLISIRRHPALRVLGLGSIAFALGLASGAAHRPSDDALTRIAREIPECSFAGRAVEDAGPLGTVVALESVTCDGVRLAPGGTVVVERVRWAAGTHVAGEGWLAPLQDDPFDEARARLGARAVLSLRNFRAGSISPWYRAAAASVRSSLYEAISAVDARAAALLLGLTLGDTADFDPETLERFRRSGLSHLLAVSGSNVAIVLGVVALAARNLWLAARVTAASVALVFFLLVVGPDASVLRAVAMGAVTVSALAWGRSADSLHALVVALVALIALRPALLFAVGLHLSAAATAGIIVWARPLERRLTFLPGPMRLVAAATLAAQAAVLPLLVGTFGRVSVVAPLANVLAFAAVAPATVLSLLAALVGLVHGRGAELLVSAAEPFARWILFVADRMGEPAWSSLALPRWCGWAAGVAAVAVAGSTLRTASKLRGTSPPGARRVAG